MEIKVLDKGFVKLIDQMGDDLSAVKAARVSYGKGSKGAEKDKKLINYLMKHGHHTPFEHIVFTFHIKTPIFVARQWMRHRIASYNEISRRYTVIEKEEFYIPDHVRIPTKNDKQASVKIEDENLLEELKNIFQEIYEITFNRYRKLLDMGVARELARIILPLGQYTQFYWTVNVRSLMNFINLRADSHAQWEIQQYALAIAKIFKEKCPWTYEAFLKYYYKGDLLNNNDFI